MRACWGRKIEEHGAKVWLINTGWTGGPHGVGSRMKIPYTRAMINAALNGELDNVEYATDPVFGLEIPTSVPGVPAEVLVPAQHVERPGGLRRPGGEAGQDVCGQLQAVCGPGVGRSAGGGAEGVGGTVDPVPRTCDPGTSEVPGSFLTYRTSRR